MNDKIVCTKYYDTIKILDWYYNIPTLVFIEPLHCSVCCGIHNSMLLLFYIRLFYQINVNKYYTYNNKISLVS